MSSSTQHTLPSQIKQSEMGIWVTADKINTFKSLEGSYPYIVDDEELHLNVSIIEAEQDEIGTDNIATCTALGCYTKTASFLTHLDCTGCVEASLPIIHKFLTLTEADDKIWYLCNGYLFFDDYLSELVEVFTNNLSKSGSVGYMGFNLNSGQHFAINVKDGTYKRVSDGFSFKRV